MLGAAKTLISEVAPPPKPYSCFITPAFIGSRSGNGSATTPRVTVSVVSGVGPFEYEWTINTNKIEVLYPDSDNTPFRASGYNREVEGIATVTVTDTGNANAQVTAEVGVLFLFGTLN